MWWASRCTQEPSWYILLLCWASAAVRLFCFVSWTAKGKVVDPTLQVALKFISYLEQILVMQEQRSSLSSWTIQYNIRRERSVRPSGGRELTRWYGSCVHFISPHSGKWSLFITLWWPFSSLCGSLNLSGMCRQAERQRSLDTWTERAHWRVLLWNIFYFKNPCIFYL